MAREVLPVVKHTPVLAGVNGTDPFVLWDDYFDRLERLGFAGVQNFPTVGLFDGQMRQQLEKPAWATASVAMIARAHARGFVTTPYVFNPREAVQMAEAGADIVVVTWGSPRAAASAPRDHAVAGRLGGPVQRMRGGVRTVRSDVIMICHGGPIAEPDDAAYMLAHCRAATALRRVEHGAPAHRARADRARGASPRCAPRRDERPERGAWTKNRPQETAR